MATKKVRAHLLIEGRVQGVSFRWWAAGNAKSLGLLGWAKNLDDGRVEAVFEGEKGNVEKMVEGCKKGSWAAKVVHVYISWEKATGEFKNFEIVA